MRLSRKYFPQGHKATEKLVIHCIFLRVLCVVVGANFVFIVGNVPLCGFPANISHKDTKPQRNWLSIVFFFVFFVSLWEPTLCVLWEMCRYAAFPQIFPTKAQGARRDRLSYRLFLRGLRFAVSLWEPTLCLLWEMCRYAAFPQIFPTRTQSHREIGYPLYFSSCSLCRCGSQLCVYCGKCAATRLSRKCFPQGHSESKGSENNLREVHLKQFSNWTIPQFDIYKWLSCTVRWETICHCFFIL